MSYESIKTWKLNRKINKSIKCTTLSAENMIAWKPNKKLNKWNKRGYMRAWWHESPIRNLISEVSIVTWEHKSMLECEYESMQAQ